MRFLKNLFIALIVSILVFFAVDKGIKWYTSHLNTIEIPDLRNLNYHEAFDQLNGLKLIPIIQDSVYDEEAEKFAITDQDPDPKRMVKEGRKVYLTINALPKPKVRMPKLVNKSINLGRALLKNTGLDVGNINTKYSLFGSGVILQQYFGGDSIASGKLIEKGSKIDLLVSKYIDIDRVYIRGVDTSQLEGWEYKVGFMNEKALKAKDKIDRNAKQALQDSTGKDG
jgi:beta-lactam-binding protein with PASTA domain